MIDILLYQDLPKLLRHLLITSMYDFIFTLYSNTQGYNQGYLTNSNNYPSLSQEYYAKPKPMGEHRIHKFSLKFSFFFQLIIFIRYLLQYFTTYDFL